MNILIFLSPNPLKTSGIVGLDLFNGFRNNGHNVKMLVNNYYPDYPEGIDSMETKYSRMSKSMKERFVRRLNKLGIKLNSGNSIITDHNYHFHELDEQKTFYRTKKLLKKAILMPDVIFILFAKNFINAKNIYELNQITHSPIFWLMYDMAPLTGGCHYAWDCEGYQNNCGNCPGLFSSNAFDISFANLSFKKKYLDRTNIQVLTGSEWQDRQAKKSSLFRNKPIHKVLLSVDSNIFKPVDKSLVRLKMGISNNKKVIFFGALGLADKRKGFSYLLDSLRILKEKLSCNNSHIENDILLLIAGNGLEGITDVLTFNYHYLGMVDNTYGIASAYQAADVFLCPSIEDSGPTMINQSIMCGTPVVSFEMGVSLDLVINGETGYMAHLRDSSDMAQGLFDILNLDAKTYKKLSDNCREVALKKCSPEVQIDEIEKIIKNSITR